MIDGFDITFDGDPHIVQRLFDAMGREYAEIMRERTLDVPLANFIDPVRVVVMHPNLRGRVTLRSPAMGCP